MLIQAGTDFYVESTMIEAIRPAGDGDPTAMKAAIYVAGRQLMTDWAPESIVREYDNSMQGVVR